MDVVGRGAGVAAQQLAAVFANAAEFHVVVVLLLGRRPGGHAHPHADLRDDPVLAVLLEILKVLVLGLPLDSLFLLRAGDIIDVGQSNQMSNSDATENEKQIFQSLCQQSKTMHAP